MFHLFSCIYLYLIYISFILNNVNGFQSLTPSFLTKSSITQLNAFKSTLDDSTLWRISFKFVEDGQPEQNAIVRVRLIEARGYEPPQGRIFVEDDYNGLIKVDDQGYSGIWTLSEDKDDRKDGLWIWGLFEEPKYPYLYFNLNIYDDLVLPSGEKEAIFKSIKKTNDNNNRLNLRFNHVRDKERGVVLSDGQMTYQVDEKVKADPLGIGGQVDVPTFVDAGIVEMNPVFNIDSN